MWQVLETPDIWIQNENDIVSLGWKKLPTKQKNIMTIEVVTCQEEIKIKE